MQEVITYISGHFVETIVLILLVALFFKDTLTLWLNLKFGLFPTEEQRRTLQMSNDMTALKMHFNDETTHILTDIQVMMAKSEEDHQKFSENQVAQCAKLEEIRDTLRDMQRNGIRIRT